MTQLRRTPTPPSGSHTKRAVEPGLPWVGLIALASAIFISQTAEFLPGGLLPGMATEFGRSYAQVGQLITVFAASVIVTTTPLAVLVRRLDRKSVAIAAFVVILVATVAASIAPSFEALMAARIIGGAAHGLFWAVAASYAVELVPASQLGRATAITAAGGTLSGLLGIPIGNALGQFLGWRSGFLMIAILGVVVLVVMIVWLPRVRMLRVTSSRSPRGLPPALGRVLLLCCAILVIVLGQLVFSTYSVPWLTEVGGLSSSTIPLYLLGSGIVGGVGVALTGQAADRAPGRAFGLLGGVVLLTTALLPFAANGSVVMVVLLGLCAGGAFAGIPLLLQARMMRTAPPETRSIAAALQTISFNIAIGGGAAVGGLALERVGLEVLPLVAVVITGLAVAVVVVVDFTSHRRQLPGVTSGSTS